MIALTKPSPGDKERIPFAGRVINNNALLSSLAIIISQKDEGGGGGRAGRFKIGEGRKRFRFCSIPKTVVKVKEGLQFGRGRASHMRNVSALDPRRDPSICGTYPLTPIELLHLLLRAIAYIPSHRIYYTKHILHIS